MTKFYEKNLSLKFYNIMLIQILINVKSQSRPIISKFLEKILKRLKRIKNIFKKIDESNEASNFYFSSFIYSFF